jgi:hypothetical protein
MAGAVHHGGRPLFMTHGLTSRQPGRWTCCPYRRTVLLRPALGDVTVVAGRENRFFAETRQGGPGPGWRREHETVVFNSWAVAFRAPPPFNRWPPPTDPKFSKNRPGPAPSFRQPGSGPSSQGKSPMLQLFSRVGCGPFMNRVSVRSGPQYGTIA